MAARSEGREGGEIVGSYFLMEFQFRKMKKWVHNNVKILDALNCKL